METKWESLISPGGEEKEKGSTGDLTLGPQRRPNGCFGWWTQRFRWF